MRKPVAVKVVVPDTTPFVKLAEIGRLDLFDRVTSPFVITDMVAFEMREGRHAVIDQLGDWLDRRSHRVEIVPTEIGRVFFLARRADPQLCSPNLGELALAEFVLASLQGAERSFVPLVLFEDRDIIERTDLPRMKQVHLINLTAFIRGLGRAGALEDADTVLNGLAGRGRLNDPYEKPARTRAIGSQWAGKPPKGILS